MDRTGVPRDIPNSALISSRPLLLTMERKPAGIIIDLNFIDEIRRSSLIRRGLIDDLDEKL